MENPELTEIFEQFRFEVIEWRATRSGHCWTARQKAYQSALDKMGVQWLEKTQAYFKSRLDEIESSIKKHNCPCGFSCEDDRYFQTHMERTHLVNEVSQVWDETLHTGSWHGVCIKCGKRERYYHTPTKKLFDLCAVCGVEAIEKFINTPLLVPDEAIYNRVDRDWSESDYCGDPDAYTQDLEAEQQRFGETDGTTP